MGSGQVELLTQEMDEQRAALDLTGDGFSVHRHRYGGHW
jgi:hypothetical protein